MTLVQLRHLADLAQTLSFSRSAKRLFLTQPALSRSIQALEEELGHALFDRVGRRIELTGFGQSVAQRARQLLDQADALRDSGRAMRDGEIGQIRIGLGSGPGALFTTALLTHMARHAPRAQVQISRGSTELLVQALRERQLDALVIDIRALSPASDLQVELLGEMTAAFMCRKAHPLARLKSVRWEHLRRYPIASTPLSDEVSRMLVERYGATAHPDQMVTLRCDELSSLVDTAQHSDTVLLAVRAVAPGLRALPVVPSLNARARFGMVTLASRSDALLLGKLRSLLLDCMHD
ncbi:MAG: LysR family transcriptional regulator [Pseudomonadota bacterium]|tara:strand:- start:536 stop:1417 length:882 start_codon:yes stop_codon:yes gene_type:complete